MKQVCQCSQGDVSDKEPKQQHRPSEQARPPAAGPQPPGLLAFGICRGATAAASRRRGRRRARAGGGTSPVGAAGRDRSAAGPAAVSGQRASPWPLGLYCVAAGELPGRRRRLFHEPRALAV